MKKEELKEFFSCAKKLEDDYCFHCGRNTKTEQEPCDCEEDAPVAVSVERTAKGKVLFQK